MGIIPTASPKCPGKPVTPGNSATYSPGADSLMIERGKSGNRKGSAVFCFIRNSSSALESGLSGRWNPCSAAISAIRIPSRGSADDAPKGRKMSRRQVSSGHTVRRYHKIFNKLFCTVFSLPPGYHGLRRYQIQASPQWFQG